MSPSLRATVLAVATAAALASNAASGATITGRVHAIDAAAHRLTLRHHVFHWSQALHAGDIRKGEHLRLTYHWNHGKRWVTAFRPIAAQHMAAAHHMGSKTHVY